MHTVAYTACINVLYMCTAAYMVCTAVYLICTAVYDGVRGFFACRIPTHVSAQEILIMSAAFSVTGGCVDKNLQL